MAKLHFSGPKWRNFPFSGGTLCQNDDYCLEGRFALTCQISWDFDLEAHDFY